MDPWGPSMKYNPCVITSIRLTVRFERDSMGTAKINPKTIIWVTTIACCLGVLLFCTGCSQSDEASDEVTNNSVVLYVDDDTVLMADTDTEAVYFPYIPSNGLYGEDGQPLAIADLEPGDLVVVTGNGAMAEIYQAQYPGITRIDVVGFDDSYVSEYDYIISRIFPDADPSEVPTAFAEYDIEDVGNITIALDAHSYSIQTPNGEISEDGQIITDEGLVLEGVPDMVITDTNYVRVGFSTTISEASVTCIPTEEVDGVGLVADVDDEYSITFDSSDDEVSFNVIAGNLYTVIIQCEAGEAAYSFIVK